MARSKFDDGLTPLQSRFVHEYVIQGFTDASAALRVANPRVLKWTPKAVWVQASKLMANAKVTQRIAELQAKAALRSIVTVESLAKELDVGMQYAVQFEQIGPYVSAIVAKARLFGLIVDKKEIRTGSLDNVGVEELRVMDDAISAFNVRRQSEIIERESANKTSH